MCAVYRFELRLASLGLKGGPAAWTKVDHDVEFQPYQEIIPVYYTLALFFSSGVSVGEALMHCIEPASWARCYGALALAFHAADTAEPYLLN